MSKVLLDKINNILDIDKNHEYINFSLQSYEDFINLELLKPIEEIENFIDYQNELNFEFRNDYQEILEKIKTFEDYQELNNYLNTKNLDYHYESKIFNQKWSQKKLRNANNSKIAKFSNDEVILMKEEFFYYKKSIYENIKKIF